MKLLDRYVVGSFLKNYLIAFMVVVGMRIVLDLILQYDELIKVNIRQGLTGFEALGTFVRTAGSYYFYQAFLYFAQMAGLIPVVAAAFTTLRMSRFNEMGALLASGVPMQRIAMPIAMTALLLQGVLWLDQELLIPNMIPKLVRSRDYASLSDNKVPLRGMRDCLGGRLVAQSYDPTATPPRIEKLSILYLDDDDRVTLINAAAATWDAAGGRWLLQDGVKQEITLDEAGAVTYPTTRPAVTEYASDVTPEEIRLFRSGEFVDMLSTSRINELLQRPMSYGRNALLRVKYSRGPAQMALNMVVLLVALSTVLVRDPTQLMKAALNCAVACGTCLGFAVGAQIMAAKPPNSVLLADRWPAIMAWLPVFIFAPVAVVMLARVKT